MYNTVEDVVNILTVQMSTAATVLSVDGMESAVDSALKELKWTYPISDPTKMLWVSKRTMRHACYILWVASAQKFKYKQVNLQQRFDHYEKLVKHMDMEYEEAVANDITLFAGVDSYKMFGTAIGPGFVYDAMGRDLTYTDLIALINTGE